MDAGQAAIFSEKCATISGFCKYGKDMGNIEAGNRFSTLNAECVAETATDMEEVAPTVDLSPKNPTVNPLF